MGQAKALVDRMWTILEAQQFEQLGEVCSPEIAVRMPGDVRLHGVEPLADMLRAYFVAFPDLRHEVVDVVEAGETIAVELRIDGTHAGTMHTPNGPILPTGRRVAWESVDLVKIADGRIVSWKAYYDQMAVLQQLGLLAEPVER